ncbi:MAG: hypothetical protein INQ03_13420 [Candidatus Heimdallarchaeota archaeon]|nr:hypothetical protein [Candidatus Heimdallarchaeota archaeon]
MRAVINQGTDKEIAWDMDDYVSPDLVNSIRMAGIEKNIDWSESPLYDLVEILLENQSIDELSERIFDEDPILQELITKELKLWNITQEDDEDKIRQLAHLYLPVLLVIAQEIDDK